MTSSARITLLEDFLLTAHLSNDGRLASFGTGLDCGLVGAVMVELVMNERIAIRSGKVILVDGTPIGHPVIDYGLRCVEASNKQRSGQWWVNQLKNDTRRLLISQLLDRGLLTMLVTRQLGVIVIRRLQISQPEVRSAIIDRLSRGLASATSLDDRTASLIGLLGACGVSPASLVTLTNRTARYTPASWPALPQRPAIVAIGDAVRVGVLTAMLSGWS